MSGPHPSVAAVRVHLRRALEKLPRSSVVLAACSGGADSMSLASAALFEGARSGWRVGVVTVDHRLQAGSGEISERVRCWGEQRGAEVIEVLPVDVGREGGMEAAAREARYAALEDAAQRHGAAAVLLGHTRDDQAETVLLALERGSGARALSGMAPQRGVFCRPVLQLSRAVLREAAEAEKLPFWDDPHNTQRRFARVRVRELLALWEAEHPGVTVGLSRSADLARADAEYLDAVAASALEDVVTADGALDAVALEALPDAIRRRVLHRWILSLGAPAGSVSSKHVEAVDALVMRWNGKGAVALPGGVEVRRMVGHLRVSATQIQRAFEGYRECDPQGCEEYLQGGPSAPEAWPEYQPRKNQ